MAIVYRHRRLDTNEIFYVGIGKAETRAHNKSNNRSLFWKNIVNKTNYSVEIIARDISWEEACELEVILIREYGRKDLKTGILVNLTNGGDGSKGYKRIVPMVFSKESRLKMSESQKKNGISKEQRLKINHGFRNMKSISKKNMSKTQFKPKKVINTITKKTYNSAKELSEIIDVNYATLKNWLNGRTINKSEYKYL